MEKDPVLEVLHFSTKILCVNINFLSEALKMVNKEKLILNQKKQLPEGFTTSRFQIYSIRLFKQLTIFS